MPIVTQFGNNIVHNLEVLAGFDLRTDIQKMGGSKLNIDTHTGQFSMGRGWGNAWNRNAESSLTQADNRTSVTNLLKEALNQFKKEGVTQNHEFRKKLVEAIRGYRWLLSSYISNRKGDENRKTSYNTSLKELDEIEEGFWISLKKAITLMEGFHQYYREAQPGVNILVGQNSYMDDENLLGGGICQGISYKWLFRWVGSGKSSILDSSKGRVTAEVLNKSLNQFKQDNPDVYKKIKTSYKGNEVQTDLYIKKILSETAKGLNVFELTKNRLQKKGSEMFALQNEQTSIKEGGNIQEIIKSAKDRLIQKQKELEEYNKQPREYNIFNLPQIIAVPFDYKQRLKDYDSAAQRWGTNHGIPNQDTNDFLNRIASKYEQVSLNNEGSITFTKNMYYRDASEFFNAINDKFQEMITDSITELNNSKNVGYSIGWRAGSLEKPNGYMYSGDKKITQSGGHAMAFHITNNKEFLVFDPNYGEFTCNDGNQVKEHFSRWFSLYSRKSAISGWYWQKISKA